MNLTEKQEFNKTKTCPWGFTLDGLSCNATDCNNKCEPKRGGKRWK
jgi:hypothetical protein